MIKPNFLIKLPNDTIQVFFVILPLYRLFPEWQTLHSILTSVFHSNLDGARVFFFSSSCWEDGCCGWVSLSKFCSGLKIKCSIFCIHHSVFTKTVKRVIPTVQCLDMRITPEPSCIKRETLPSVCLCCKESELYRVSGLSPRGKVEKALTRQLSNI